MEFEFGDKRINLPGVLRVLRTKVGEDALCLDLGAGNDSTEGFRTVDLYHPKADYKVDLFGDNWPWEDDSVDLIYSSHFLEHVPDWDKFWNEVYRIMKPGSISVWRTPYYLSMGATQDPTHKQMMSEGRYWYLNEKHREEMNVSWYMPDIDFRMKFEPWYVYAPQWANREQSVKDYARNHIPNACLEMVYFLETIKTDNKE